MLLKCLKCGAVKPEEEFYRRNDLAVAEKQRKRAAPRNYRSSWCKACELVYNKQRRDRLKVENPEWKAKEDARRLFNYTNNYPKHWASRQASRAKKAGSSGIISWEEWQELLKEHDGKCHWCGLKLHPSFMSLDHVQPLCRGGLNIKANAVPSCINCNHQRKWYDELKYPEIYKKHYGACEAVEEQVAA